MGSQNYELISYDMLVLLPAYDIKELNTNRDTLPAVFDKSLGSIFDPLGHPHTTGSVLCFHTCPSVRSNFSK